MGCSRSYLTGLVLVGIAALAWSTSGLFTRLLTLEAPTILFWRGLFGAMGTALVMAMMPSGRGLGSFQRLGRAGFADAAVTALSMLLFISALLTTTVAHVAILTATIPFAAALLGWAFLRDVPQRRAVIAGHVALAGVAVMVGISADGTGMGDLLAAMMALCMGGMILISRRFPAIPALAATCLASALCALATMPFASFDLTTPEVMTLGLFALVNPVLGFALFALGARLLPPMETALMGALDAPLAPLWVWLLFAEAPGRATLLGGGIVFGAVLVFILAEGRRQRLMTSPQPAPISRANPSA